MPINVNVEMRIFAFTGANASHLAPSLCEKIRDNIPASCLLSDSGLGFQEE
jgi:hypothetical protein